MSTPRVLIQSDVVTVAKTGYSAVNPPAVSYDYLALDSRLNNFQPLEIGFVPTWVFGDKVYYTKSYAVPPVVDMFFVVTYGGNSGSTKGLMMRDELGSNVYQRSQYFINHYNDGFKIDDALVTYRATTIQGTKSLVYYAWDTADYA